MKDKKSKKPPIKIKLTIKKKVAKHQDKLNINKENVEFNNESQKLQVGINEKTNSTDDSTVFENKVSY